MSDDPREQITQQSWVMEARARDDQLSDGCWHTWNTYTDEQTALDRLEEVRAIGNVRREFRLKLITTTTRVLRL